MPVLEFELTARKLELIYTQASITDLENELAKACDALADFQSRYTNSVGVLYQKLDEIHAEINCIADVETPPSAVAMTAQGFADPCPIALSTSSGLIKLSSEIRHQAESSTLLVALFRKAAIKLHPDLASDEQERERRCRAMAQINSAYELGDCESIDWILAQWESTSGHVVVDDISKEINCVIRNLAMAKKRLAQLELQLDDLKSSDWYSLFQKERYFKSRGKDLIKLLSRDAQREIEQAEKVLNSIKKERNS